MKFQWKGEELATYGQLGDALCALSTKEEATEFWNAYVAYLDGPEANIAGRTAEAVARSNVGYLMGYYDTATRERVYGLFAAQDVSHPIFGHTTPTPDEAFDAGAKAMTEHLASKEGN